MSNAQINQELLTACKSRLACDEEWIQGTKEWHDAVLTADEQMKAAICHATEKEEQENDRVSSELAEIYRLNQLNAEMLVMLKDITELMADDTGEWIDSVRALIERVQEKIRKER